MTHRFKAAIFDMDGVLTQTATLHAKSWKLMFDEFLKKREGDNFKPLNIETDYRKFIDGIPRFDGVRSFLKSRNIELPEGNPGDEPGQGTVYGLGMRKNEIFNELLERKGLQVYDDALEVIKKWKQDGMKLAVISSSRNAKDIMNSAGLSGFFDASIDGEMLADDHIKGKPEPDIFLQASNLLGADVRQTIIIEDAIQGVQAGKRGNFALVVGVARDGGGIELKEAGADIVVTELTEMESKMEQLETGSVVEDLPHALKEAEAIFEILGVKKPTLFLDYDGTLTPIVSEPDEALLSDKAKHIITELSNVITVGVISGRDLKDIKSKVGLDGLIYAGTHGFDIIGSNELEMQYEPGKKSLPALDEAEKNLLEKLKHVEGVWVERKKYAIAVHYRKVADEKVEEVKQTVYDELNRYDSLKKGSGKKILELKPNIDWDKGYAINWIMDTINANADHMPVFIGDDITDEDAFKAIRDRGIGIIVGTHGQKTSANYRLNDTEEVMQFLDQLIHHVREKITT